ncbi:MAG: alpha/beta family hydrolase [Flavobacterium sp.]
MHQRNKKIIFLIGRDNWQKDDALNHVLVRFLKKSKHEIKWEDPAGHLLYAFRSYEHKLKWLPTFISVLNLRIVQIFYGIFHWNYFVYLFDRRNNCVELRKRRLKRSIEKLDSKKELIVLARSAGGRFASSVADDLKIKNIICLSYPFKHPDSAVEPDRYLHLRDLKTPMLIIQGNLDEYGGQEVKDTYIFSPNIELFFVNTNHDFHITAFDWQNVLLKLEEYIC